MAIPGYAGKILRVDLTNERVWAEDLDEATARQWLGGTGLGAKILYDEVPPGVEWNDPDNRLILASGPLAGTRVIGSGTYSVVTKGPLTNGATSSQANGYFGAYLKFSGFDAIVIQGQARRWLYLHIHDGMAELCEASYLRGKDTWETDDAIKEELGYKERDASVYCIGPSGENLCLLAGICGDKGHIAGHNGTGAVMGTKRLKAVVAARGRSAVPVVDRQALSREINELFDWIKTDPMASRQYRYGTLDLYQMIHETGRLPIRNYTTDIYPDAAKLEAYTGPNIRETFSPKRSPCWACQMFHCHVMRVPDGPFKGRIIEEPEYEGLAQWGANIGPANVWDAAFLATEVDRLGFETNGAGWVVSMVMELYEKGVLTKSDTDGLEMTWGNVHAARQLLYKMAWRDGFGDVLADGAKAAAERLGGEALQVGIYTHKGGVPRGHDHRASWAEMFETATSSTGTLESGRSLLPQLVGREDFGDPFNPDDVVDLHVLTKGAKPFEDSMGTCTFTTRSRVDKMVAMVNAITGWDMTFDEGMEAGLRITNLMRAFDLRHGLTAELDLVGPSERYGSTPVDGPAAGISIRPHWEHMVHSYYEKMGWDRQSGRPYPETLQRLGLERVVADIWEPEVAR